MSRAKEIALESLSEGKAKWEPKSFPDTRQGAIDNFHHNVTKSLHAKNPKDYRVTRDPHVDHVWLVSHPKKKFSAIMYNKTKDGGSVSSKSDHEKAMKRHGPHEFNESLDESNSKWAHEAEMNARRHDDLADEHHDAGRNETAEHHENAADSYRRAARAYRARNSMEGDKHSTVAGVHADNAEESKRQHLGEAEETIQQRMARQRAAREARDGTPEEVEARKKKAAGEKAVADVEKRMKKLDRLADRISKMHKAKHGFDVGEYGPVKKVHEATKADIDAIGKHHSDRMGKSNPDAEYHAVMRNRASRLKSLRDHTGPNVPATKTKHGRKLMLKYAGEDSRKAKTLKPKD